MAKREVEPGGYPEAMPVAVREFVPAMQLMWLEEQGIGFMEDEELSHWKGVIRRRGNRPHRRGGASWLREQQQREREEEKRLAKVEEHNQHTFTREMCIRIYHSVDDAPPTARKYVYWTARYCGWDVLAPGDEPGQPGYEIRRTSAGVKCGAEECAIWLYWINLWPQQRAAIVRETMMIYEPFRSQMFADDPDDEEPSVYAKMMQMIAINPAFELVAPKRMAA